jgi:hypothetical protein
MLPLGGTYISFWLKRSQLQNAMEHRIRKAKTEENLEIVKIPKSLEANPDKTFKRIHSREFRFLGNMYDVVRQEDRGSETWYWAIHDEEETVLYAKMDELKRKAWGDEQLPNEHRTKLERLYPNFIFSAYKLSFSKYYLEKVNSNGLEIPSQYKSILSEIPNPPPQLHFNI